MPVGDDRVPSTSPKSCCSASPPASCRPALHCRACVRSRANLARRPATVGRAYAALARAGAVTPAPRRAARVARDGAAPRPREPARRAPRSNSPAATIRCWTASPPAADRVGAPRQLRRTQRALAALAPTPPRCTSTTATASYNAPFAARVLAGREPMLVHLWRREQGIIVAARQPRRHRGVRRPASDARSRCAPTGTGTRVLLDRLLREAGAGSRRAARTGDAHAPRGRDRGRRRPRRRRRRPPRGGRHVRARLHAPRMGAVRARPARRRRSTAAGDLLAALGSVRAPAGFRPGGERHHPPSLTFARGTGAYDEGGNPGELHQNDRRARADSTSSSPRTGASSRASRSSPRARIRPGTSTTRPSSRSAGLGVRGQAGLLRRPARRLLRHRPRPDDVLSALLRGWRAKRRRRATRRSRSTATSTRCDVNSPPPPSPGGGRRTTGSRARGRVVSREDDRHHVPVVHVAQRARSSARPCSRRAPNRVVIGGLPTSKSATSVTVDEDAAH